MARHTTHTPTRGRTNTVPSQNKIQNPITNKLILIPLQSQLVQFLELTLALVIFSNVALFQGNTGVVLVHVDRE